MSALNYRSLSAFTAVNSQNRDAFFSEGGFFPLQNCSADAAYSHRQNVSRSVTFAKRAENDVVRYVGNDAQDRTGKASSVYPSADVSQSARKVYCVENSSIVFVHGTVAKQIYAGIARSVYKMRNFAYVAVFERQSKPCNAGVFVEKVQRAVRFVRSDDVA